MQQTLRLAPSLLSADFARLGDEAKAMEKAGADWLHFDAMDGHFVPNLTFGPQAVRALRGESALFFDVHLMIAPVDPFLQAFVEAGADGITVHPEAGPHVMRSLQTIRKLGKRAGVALNPGTPVEVLWPLLDEVDLVLIMSVNPGFGGQSFIPSQLDKIRAVRERLDKTGNPADLQVDGGIDPDTARLVVEAGADVVVAGTACFKGGQGCFASNLKALRGEAAC